MVKTCRFNQCPEPRYYNSSLCKKHYYQHQKDLKKEKAIKKLENKKLTKKYQESIKKTLFNKAWKLISEEVRKSGADEFGIQTCYTCGDRKPWKEMHCSHRYHGRLDLDYRNLKPSCVCCNTYLHGNLGNYERHLIKDYGLEWAEQLARDANQHKGYSLEDLKRIINELQNL